MTNITSLVITIIVLISNLQFDYFLIYEKNNNARQKDTDKLHRVVKQAGKIRKCKVDLDKVCSEKVVVPKAQAIVTDDTHLLHDNYKMLRSGRRWQSIRARTNRYLNSFVPHTIRLMNQL